MAAVFAGVMAEGPHISTLEGSRDWNFYSILPSTAGWQTKKTFIEIANADAGELTVHFAGGYPVRGVYDQEARTITFADGQVIGHNDNGDYDIYFYHDRYYSDESGRYQTGEPLVVSVNSNTIDFDYLDCVAIGNRSKGYFYYGYQNELKRIVPGDVEMPEEGWVFSHVARFTDGWHTHAVAPDFKDVPYEVEVERHEETDGLYRLVNPYGEGTPVYDENQDKTSHGYIVFSVADPEFVTVWPCIYSGYDDPYIGKCYNYNIEGQQKELFGYDKEEILNLNLLPEGISTYDRENGLVTVRNVYFGVLSDLCGDYQWSELPQVSTITMPAQGSDARIVAEQPDTQARPRYYNLQGQSLGTRPASGACIEVSGTKSRILLR